MFLSTLAGGDAGDGVGLDAGVVAAVLAGGGGGGFADGAVVGGVVVVVVVGQGEGFVDGGAGDAGRGGGVEAAVAG